MGLSEAEDLISYGTLTVDLQNLQSDFFKRMNHDHQECQQTCVRKGVKQLNCLWSDRSGCQAIGCSQKSYYQRVERIYIWIAKIHYDKLVLIIRNK